MAKTPAERQAAYRARRDLGDGDYRLNGWVSSKAHFALKRLITHYDVTQREMLERLIIAEDERIWATIEVDSPEEDNYSKRKCVTP